MILLGIDPGLQFSGYCVVKKDAKVAVIDFGYLQMKSADSIVDRVAQFHAFFSNKIVSLGVTHLAIETPFLGKNAQTFLKLGYLRGILFLLSHQHKLDLAQFSPREVKLAVTGFGGASKLQVARALEQLFPPLKEVIKTARNDVSDAVAVSITGLYQALSASSRILKR